MDISEDIPKTLIGDKLRLGQIIFNLVGNAIKFTKKGGISISVVIKKVTKIKIILYFEINDTGIGISKENQKSIFDPFTQVEDSMTKNFSGTGLGTAISKQLVNLMRGNIGLTGEVSKGSTFWFTAEFKKSTQKDEREETNKEIILSKTENQTIKKAKILLAEDYPLNRKVATIHLNKLGCKIDHAENGKIAVEMFINGNYDLILMDIQMPELNGMDAVKKIRNMKNGKNIPIIAITANAYEEDIRIYKENGFNDTVTKPFSKKGLNKAVIKWILHKKPRNLNKQ